MKKGKYKLGRSCGNPECTNGPNGEIALLVPRSDESPGRFNMRCYCDKTCANRHTHLKRRPTPKRRQENFIELAKDFKFVGGFQL